MMLCVVWGRGESCKFTLRHCLLLLELAACCDSVSVHGVQLMAFGDFTDGSREKENQIQKVRTQFDGLAR